MQMQKTLKEDMERLKTQLLFKVYSNVFCALKY